MRFYVLLSILCFMGNSYALEFPRHCKGIDDIDQQLVIKGKEQQLVLIANTSKSSLWLTHTPKEPAASAGWSSELKSQKFSALAMARDGFSLDCTESSPGHAQRVACQDVIKACVLEAKFAKKAQGDYWVAENLDLQTILSRIESRHISLTS